MTFHDWLLAAQKNRTPITMIDIHEKAFDPVIIQEVDWEERMLGVVNPGPEPTLVWVRMQEITRYVPHV